MRNWLTRLTCYYLIESFNYQIQFPGSRSADFFIKTIDEYGADLAYFIPGFFRKFQAGKFQGQRETGFLWLAGDGHGDHRAGMLIENILAQDKHRPETCLFMSDSRIQTRIG